MSANDLRFIGIALPGELERKLLALQKRLYEPGTMLKPLHPHITLLHPVSLLYIDQEKLLPKVQAIAKKLLPLRVTLSEFDHFENQTFHITINHHEHDLHHLQHELVSLLPNRVRVQHYSQPFRPHITICQSRTGELHHHSLYEQAKEQLNLSHPLEVTVNDVNLFEHTGPREYSVEKI
jgi:2'-5' RNA ligase